MLPSHAVEVLRARADALLHHGAQDAAALVEGDQDDTVRIGCHDFGDLGIEVGAVGS